METNDLIKAIAAEAAIKRATPITTIWRLALLSAACVAAIVFLVTLGPRPDISEAAQTPRFLFKFAVTGALATMAFFAVRVLSRPDGKQKIVTLLVAPVALLAGGVLVELVSLPASEWQRRLVGTNSMVCLTFIPLIGLGPLALFLAGLRYGAPTSPALAGAVAGTLAGGIAATFYAAHCIDDSPLFVAVWYSLAVGFLAVIGAVISAKNSRW